MLSFCPANDTLSKVWQDNGFSRCFIELFSPTILLLVISVSFFIQLHRYLKCKKQRKYRKLQLQNGAQEFEILSPPQCKKQVFKGFAFSEMPRPFLFVIQWLLHAALILLPATDLVSRVILCPTCIHGSIVYQDVFLVLIWGLALRNLQRERKIFYRAHIKHHSLLFIVFWSLSLAVDVFALISWNSKLWWFKSQNSDMKLLETFTFSIRFSCNVILFGLGFLAPGLFKAPKSIIADEDEKDRRRAKVCYVHVSSLLTFPDLYGALI